MKLVLVTGLSGAGKTQAIRKLEDIGFFCVDNLPPIMIPSFLELCADKPEIKEIAVVVDIRGGIFMDGVMETIDSIKRQGVELDILFLEASDSVIIKRYKESRRIHPLDIAADTRASINREREALWPLREQATMILDTSFMPVKELWQAILGLYRPEDASREVMINIISFGYKNGIPPEADLIFDARFLPNPYYIPTMKNLSGMDSLVFDYIASFPETEQFLTRIADLLVYMLPFYLREGNKYPAICIGCTGGRHRSVAISIMLEAKLLEKGYRSIVRHKDINVDAQKKE